MKPVFHLWAEILIPFDFPVPPEIELPHTVDLRPSMTAVLRIIFQSEPQALCVPINVVQSSRRNTASASARCASTASARRAGSSSSSCRGRARVGASRVRRRASPRRKLLARLRATRASQGRGLPLRSAMAGSAASPGLLHADPRPPPRRPPGFPRETAATRRTAPAAPRALCCRIPGSSSRHPTHHGTAAPLAEKAGPRAVRPLGRCASACVAVAPTRREASRARSLPR